MADSEAKKQWDAENTTRVVMKLNNHTDADILEQLESVESKQGYIKELIRKDLRKMKRYNIYEGSNEILMKGEAMTSGDILSAIFESGKDVDANIIGSYESIEDARTALSNHTAVSKTFESAGKTYVSVKGYWIGEDEMDEDGELDESGDIWDYSFDPIGGDR